MSDDFWMAFFAFCTALLAAVQSWLTSRKVSEVAEKVEVVHKATNSLTDRLVEATAIMEYAKGRAEGIASEQREQKDQERQV